MTLVIKPDHKGVYPAKIREVNLQYVSAGIHPSLMSWYLLVMGPDGDFHSVKREHVKMVTKLEVALK